MYCEGLECSKVHTTPHHFAKTLHGWLNWDSSSAGIAYGCRGNYSYFPNDKHWYWTMHSHGPHPDMTPILRSVRSLSDPLNQQKCGHLRNWQLACGKRCVSVPAGERVSFQGGSSVASQIQGQISTTSSWLNNSCVADITQCVCSNLSATQRQLWNTPTAMLGNSRCSTPSPGGMSTRCVWSNPPPGIVITNTPPRGLETCRPRSLIQKSMWSLQNHSERELPRRMNDRVSVNCNQRYCLHMDQWSPAVAACIDLVTQTWSVLCLHWADACSSRCGTDSSVWVQTTWTEYVMQCGAFRKD
jgi:hypothetical protein